MYFAGRQPLSAQGFFTDATEAVDFARDFAAQKKAASLLLEATARPVVSRRLPVPLTKREPFFTVAVQCDGAGGDDLVRHLSVRFSPDGDEWGEWMPFGSDAHGPDNMADRYYTSQLIFASAKNLYYQIAATPDGSRALEWTRIQLFFSCPGRTSAPSAGVHPVSTARGVCPLPSYQGRSDWCSLAECPYGSNPVYTTVTHLIVHHSAGSNTASDWAAVVRSIWHYHVDVHGWADIGYNWLIDPNGVLYEGRPDNVKGAHFSGHNSGTMGVCVLGNFQDADPKVSPSAAAIETLEHLLCWKAEKEGIDPLATKYHASSGLNLKTISGHRDGGPTSCPGDSLYVLLPQIRTVVDSLLHPVATSDPLSGQNVIRVVPRGDGDVLLEYVSGYRPVLGIGIYAVSGRLVDRFEMHSDRVVAMGALPRGVYWIQVTGPHGRQIIGMVR